MILRGQRDPGDVLAFRLVACFVLTATAVVGALGVLVIFGLHP
jgi:hypothetical protein